MFAVELEGLEAAAARLDGYPAALSRRARRQGVGTRRGAG